MVKKLLLKVFAFWALILTSALGWGQDCPTSVSLTSDTGNTICDGTTVNFTATPNGGTGPFTYEWKVDDQVQGETTNQFSISTLINKQVVSVKIIEADGITCSIGNSGSPITVNPNKTPTVDFSIPSGEKCIGQEITFTASNTNGGSNPTYEWFVDGASVQNSTNNKLTRSFSGEGAYNIRVVLTTSITCYTSATAEVTKSLTIQPDASISVSDPDITNACLNDPISPIEFNVGGSATGASVTGLPSGITGSYNSGIFTISGSPTVTGSFSYTVSTTGPCANVSQGGTITILKDATINLSSGNDTQEVCQNDPITDISYNIGETGTGASVSGLPNGISGNYSGGVYTISGSASVAGTYDYTITANGDCGDSESLTGSITVNESLTPSVTITSSDSDNSICEGTSITFTATPTNGGTNPSYQWKIGDTNAGNDSETFTTTNLAIGDQPVRVVLTSNETCLAETTAISNVITTTVNENPTPSVSVTTSDSDICDGDSVTFTATATHGGTSPSYQWKVDGNNVGTDSDNFTTSSLTNGQEVTVVLTSSETCVTSATAVSDPVSVTVNPNLTPQVSINSNDSDNLICSGTNITFTATANNEGTTPSYQWFVNDSPVGENSASFSTSDLTDGQTIKVVLTSSEECLATNTAESNKITVKVDDPLTGVTPVFDYTNPAHNKTAICPVTDVTYKINPIAGARTYNWTYPSGWSVVSQNANEIILKAGVNAAGGQITVTANNDCGSSQTLSETVTTGTAVLVDAGPDQTVCLGTSTINLAGEIGGAISQGKDFKWTVSVTGGSLSNQSGNNAENKLNATYTLPASIRDNGGTITFTISSVEPAGGCAIKTDEMVLTVQKNATVSAPVNKDQTVCINNPINNIEFTITDAGTGGSVSGLPAGLSGSFTEGVYTIAGTPTEAGTFSYTVNTTGDCTGQQTSQSGTITVNPDNTIVDAENKDQTVCINTAITDMAFPINITVDNFNIEGLPGGVSGTIVGDDIIVSGTPTASGTFNYTITTLGLCESMTTAGILTVQPDVTISSPTTKSQEVCINTSIQNIGFTITSPGTSANVTGLPEGLTGNFSNGIFTISGTASEAGTFNYEVSTTGECNQASETGTITVTPDPTAEISYPAGFCTSQSGVIDDTLTGTGEYEGGTYSASPSGLVINSTTGEITPGTSTPGTYTITYEGPEVCNRAVATTEITINEEPFVEISYDGPFCTSDANLKNPTFSNGIGSFEGGTFSSDPGGLIIDAGTGQINPQNTSPGTYTVYYTIDAANGCDEVTVSTSVTVTQLPQVNISYPDVVCSSESAVQVAFSGGAGNYENGIFSATQGLSIDTNGVIDASSSTPGRHTVTYTIAAASGCEEVISSTDLIIKEIPVITTDPVNTGTCSNSPAQFEVVATGDDLIYQWYRVLEDGTYQSLAGENDPILYFSNATSADAGAYFVVISGSDACTEDTSDQVTLNVDEDIVISDPSEDMVICEDQEEFVEFIFRGHANGSPLTFKWIKDGEEVIEDPGKIDFSNSGPEGTNGEYTGKLKITDPASGADGDSGVYYVVVDGPDYFTCPEATSKTFTFNVIARPEPPTYTNAEYCLNEDAGNLSANAATDHTIRWYTYDDSTMEYTYIGDNIAIDTSTPNFFEYYATQTAPNGCESDFTSEPLIITVLDKPDPVSSEPIQFNYCHNEQVTEALSVAPADGATINWYETIDATTTVSAPVPNTSIVQVTTYYVSQTFTSTGCESDRTAVEIKVNALPNIKATVADAGSSDICLGSNINLVASGAQTYTWSLNGNEVGTEPTLTHTPGEIGINTYSLTGIDENGCTNTTTINIEVEEPSEGGTVSGQSSVCVTDNQGSITVTDFKGEIQRWESSTDGTNWTTISETSEILNFQDLSGTTTFRAIVKNGVCDEIASTSHSVSIDQEPVAGQILFKGTDRVFMMCEFPTADYLVPLQTSGTYTGEIVAWQYRRTSQTEWNTIMEGSEPFTGTTLTGEQVNTASNNESTLFRVEVGSGACSPNVFSDNATLSIIPSDIAPNPVTITRPEICIGESIQLSSGTGYGGYGTFLGGAFDNSSIANHGWRVKRFDNDTEYTFESAADNTRPERWMRTNPHDYIMANPNGSGTIYQRFDSSSGNEGNKGFAIVSGDNPSTLETPVFNTFTMDNPTLTFDQAYNLTDGDVITVQISLDGGNTYIDEPLFSVVGPTFSGNYDRFGDDGLGEPNNMVIDLSQYAGLPNLRIRWLYDGSAGGIYTIDDIGIPQDPENVQLIWYYDDDPNDPDNELEQIGEVNQSTVTYTPTKIGWNYFQVNTALVFDTNGDPCQSAENMATIQVYVFDSYTTTATANVGSCGSTEVPLAGTLTGGKQGEITEFPVDDTSTIAWTVVSGPDGYNYSEDHFSPSVSDPNAVFTPPVEGQYTLSFEITPDERNTCTITNGEVTFNFAQCTTLDFDGIDDHVIVADSYSTAQTIEAWVRPEAENGPGSGKVATIYSSQNYELFLNSNDAPVLLFGNKRYTSSQQLSLDGRWYHVTIVLGDPVKMYIDGIEVNLPNTTSSDEMGTGGQFVIGGRYNGDGVEPDNYFSGWIDELRIWNTALTEKQIRFMMNQRIKLDASGIVAVPLSGEVVPNRTVAGSYHINGNNNLDKDDYAFFDVSASSLIGYYRLISANPDPLNIYNFADHLKPSGGLTPDHSSVSKVDGRLYNIETDQQNTSPTPYVSTVDGQAWATDNTWAYSDVWDAPNSTGIDGSTPIDWNIARVNHNITSSGKDIVMLGILSETPDKVLTIDSDRPIRISHYLLLNGNMDLIGESQLLQDHGSILAEESAGWLQRDQQGKKLSYNYNYWSSPVSAQGSTPNNAPYTIFDVLRDPGHKNNPNAINYSDPYAAADGPLTDPMTLSTYWMWKFKGSASLYKDWEWIGETGLVGTGEGYTMKGTDGTVSTHDNTQNYTFKGKPHNGDLTLDFEADYENYLVGNPYPSALDANQFIQENLEGLKIGEVSIANANFNGTIYFWSHFSGKSHYLQQYIGGYAAYNLSGGVEAASSIDQRIDNSAGESGGEAPKQFIPVGQGFFVNKVISSTIGENGELDVVQMTGGESIILRNTQRAFETEAGESVFHSQEKKTINSSASKTTSDGQRKIWLKFKSPMKYHRQLLVTADANASSGFDLGYDAPLIEDIEEDMYWSPENYKFVIQGVNNFDLDQELHLEYKVKEEGQLTISIDELKNIPSEMNIFIRDSLLQVTHDLRAEDYTVESEAGTFSDRFKLVFQDRWAIEEPEEPILEDGPLEVIYVNGTREVLIKNPELLEISRVYLNNMLGQQVHVYYNIPKDREVNLPVQRFSAGVYIVKMHTEQGIISKKVILE